MRLAAGRPCRAVLSNETAARLGCRVRSGSRACPIACALRRWILPGKPASRAGPPEHPFARLRAWTAPWLGLALWRRSPESRKLAKVTRRIVIIIYFFIIALLGPVLCPLPSHRCHFYTCHFTSRLLTLVDSNESLLWVCTVSRRRVEQKQLGVTPAGALRCLTP
jgi:hypothetical protein